MSKSGVLCVRARRVLFAVALVGVLPAMPALADGMLPETSVVIVYEEKGEAQVNVRNSDARPSLLHVTLQGIPEDTEPLLFVTPPVSRVEPGENQVVRFILRNAVPLKTQRLKRVIFEGIPPKNKLEPGRATVAVNIRQNLPVIVHPKGLPLNREPWKGLTWSITNGELTVHNDTPYVVRMGQEVHLLPMMASVKIPAAYLLPGAFHSIAVPESARSAASVRIYPATVYGFAVDAYDAALSSIAR
ncbi:P pilus assembly chaperone PapD [Luteibacter sp. OK325]|uniref:fimbria/pilus chaperone family protein n=1 Tax=Luteibacter sp. OK325 TaxID=2135670 RepID=UPI000D3550F7|nr:fimbria/pilus chaperone family protein [Luteibacter sp. OK325]PTR27263.1 P pilus assembly chaperone PapD [Luteibacter sp. OK325]